MDQTIIESSLDAVIAEGRKAFTEPETADPSDALGIALAHYTRWDNGALLDIAIGMFEDANFHSLVEVLEAIKAGDMQPGKIRALASVYTDSIACSPEPVEVDPDPACERCKQRGYEVRYIYYDLEREEPFLLCTICVSVGGPGWSVCRQCASEWHTSPDYPDCPNCGLKLAG